MKVVSDTLNFNTRGFNDMKDLTGSIEERLDKTGLRDGVVNVFATGSTGGLTTIEYESGLVQDFSSMMERIVPSGPSYQHDRRWGDGNGFSHVRASLLGPSLNVPFKDGRLMLGTWQQVVFVDFDNRARTRTVFLQFMGE